LKRHDLIDANDWEEISKVETRRLADHQENMNIILPQVLMYCDSWECSRAILTDYSDTIAVDVDRSLMEHPKAPLRLSYVDVSTLGTDADVFSYGPRAMISFQVFEALRELGLLDSKVSSAPSISRLWVSAYYFHPCPQLFSHAQGEPKVISSSPISYNLVASATDTSERAVQRTSPSLPLPTTTLFAHSASSSSCVSTA